MTKQTKKLLGIAYVRLVQDEKGEVNFEYGYDIDKKQASLNDIMALQSFLGMLKDSYFSLLCSKVPSELKERFLRRLSSLN